MANVLVVDDDATVREVVVDYLRNAGHDVREATDGAGALAAVRDQRADLVVLDVMMPGLDGLERSRAVDRLVDLVAGVAEVVDDHLAHGGVVVDHQHLRHRVTPRRVVGGIGRTR